MNAWPSFREWQCTRLPEPYAARARATWARRDLEAFRSTMIKAIAPVATAIEQLAVAFGKAAAAFAPLTEAFAPKPPRPPLRLNLPDRRLGLKPMPRTGRR